ncbi:MAG: peptidoglycan DD-metalloendopeptidase family protein [Alphaproteobacteria bacterium]|nr:peptidoglycan DD-metalloendopeptidase family protein [Alphaproteobacteria bacterium]
MLRIVLTLAILGGGAISSALAGPSELDKIQSQIRQTEQKNKQLEQQVKTSDRDVAKTKKQLVTAADKVSSLEELRADITKKIAELDARRAEISAELEKNRVRVSDAGAAVLFIASHPSFDSENMHDFVLTSAILTGMSDRFDEQIQDATRKIAELDKIREMRAVEKEKLDRTAKKYLDEKALLDKLLRRRSAQNEKLRGEQAALQKKLRELSARAKTISELSAGVGSSEMSSDARFSVRKLNQPVRGRVVVRFGEKTALGLKSDGWRIRTRSDALVTAPADGVVKFADAFKGFGRVIIISHKNGYNTVMTNLGGIDVVVGQEVLAGEPIGRMNPNKPEMYLEVRRGDKAIDPARLFKEE